MQVRLEYGEDGLNVDLPDENLQAVLKLTPAPALPDPVAAVRDALAAPIGAKPLREIARGRRDACIVICDMTRPVPNQVLLPLLLDTLRDAGIPREKITILIATGTHRPNSPAEIEAMLGREISANYAVVNHVCTDPTAHQGLGTSPAGVPVALDRRYCEADLKICVGLIEPHFMAGFSGGRKMIMPGVAFQETIHAWHSPRFLEHPNATNGVIEGNPVHKESLAIARMCPPDLILDVTLDESNKITGVFAGDLLDAWLAGAAFAKSHVRVPVEDAVDIVVTTCAGHPLDATFYQAVKGMVGALPIVKPGGSIIVAASCSEGIGGEAFTRTLAETADLAVFLDRIQEPGWTVIPDQWQIEEFARAACRHTIYCVCEGIGPSSLEQLFVTPAPTVEDAVDLALARHGSDATIAAIPKGPYVIPYIASTRGEN